MSEPAPRPSAPRGARRFSRIVLAAAALAWLGAIGAGFGAMLRYANTPGRAAGNPTNAAARAGLELDAKLPTLVVFAHPACPCTRATLAELDTLAARCAGRFKGRVLFADEQALAVDWSRNELWQTAAQIPGVSVALDRGTRIAGALGVHTSGQALLFAPDGRLLFAGGITAARGHAGDNLGLDELADVLDGRRPDAPGTPVFGCAFSELPATASAPR